MISPEQIRIRCLEIALEVRKHLESGSVRVGIVGVGIIPLARIYEAYVVGNRASEEPTP